MSEVTYRSERALAAPLAGWSARLELATRLDLTSHRLASENYQLMNYGLGGSILAHRDSDSGGLEDPSYSESYHHGGPRLATIMIWLGQPTKGGRTVFRCPAQRGITCRWPFCVWLVRELWGG